MRSPRRGAARFRADSGSSWRESQLARDQIFHDLRRAAVDPLNAGIGVHARDRIFAHVAVAAEQLQAFVGDLDLLFGAPLLRHIGRFGVQRAVEQALDAVVDEAAYDMGDRRAFGELESRVLEVRSVWPKALRCCAYSTVSSSARSITAAAGTHSSSRS